MPESFDAFRYISYLRSRWKFIAVSCAAAVTLAAAASLLMTRQYTATARIVIEPPAGADLRAAMAVSPVYLESLKTYEHFADSDNLFRKAMDKFDLRAIFGSRPIESIKRRVMKVATVRNTRILEISATLPDARRAQAVAQFLAQSTADLNRNVTNEADQDLLHGIEQQAKDIRARLDRTEADWAKLLANEPVEELQSTMDKAAYVRSDIEQKMLEVQVELADGKAADKAGAQARIEEMRKQIAALDRQSAEREKLLATRLGHRDKLEADRKDEQTALAAIEARWREARSEAGYRGERLRVIDPGIVPERPSSPNIPLNLAAALLLGIVLPLVYLAFEMNYREQRALSGRRPAYQGFSKAHDE